MDRLKLKPGQRRRMLLLAPGLGLLALLAWGWVPPGQPGGECVLAQNGAWISVDWTSQPVDEAAVAQLAADMSARRIRTVMPFVTYLRQDGTWSPSDTYAAEWVATYRRFDTRALLLAWVGIPVRSERPLAPGGWADLSLPAVRKQISDLALRLTGEMGFDGVHLDVEHVDNEDPHYLRLLEEVKGALGPERLLSIAGNDWVPGIVNALPAIGNYKWGTDYVRAVGKQVDQIAVMSYDSMLPHPALYRLWLREEVKGLNRSLAGVDTQLLAGLSVSREETRTHYPRAENMASGLAGICAGYAALPAGSLKLEGIAIYAAWEADKADWALWEGWIEAD